MLTDEQLDDIGREQAMIATAGIGFWKNESRGIANMAAHLISLGKPCVLKKV